MQRKQRYRDRAAERRTLHGGFGTGPGQKGLTPQEQEKADAENAAGMDGALRTASLALPLGKDNVGKRMLEGMGWKEVSVLRFDDGRRHISQISFAIRDTIMSRFPISKSLRSG